MENNPSPIHKKHPTIWHPAIPQTKEFAELLVERRHHIGKTQKDIAVEMGIVDEEEWWAANQRINQYENGRIRKGNRTYPIPSDFREFSAMLNVLNIGWWEISLPDNDFEKEEDGKYLEVKQIKNDDGNVEFLVRNWCDKKQSGDTSERAALTDFEHRLLTAFEKREQEYHLKNGRPTAGACPFIIMSRPEYECWKLLHMLNPNITLNWFFENVVEPFSIKIRCFENDSEEPGTKFI